MVSIIKVRINEDSDFFEVPLDKDGSLSVEKIQKQCLTQRAAGRPSTGDGVEVISAYGKKKIPPPPGGWSSKLYHVEFQKDEPVSLFFEDEVCRVTRNKEIQYGMVVETAEYSSDDDSADDDDMMVQKGFVKVAWYPKGEEEIIKANKVQLTDRSLMPGDVVASLQHGLDKVGYCKSIDVTTSLRIFGFDDVILNVKSEHLAPILELGEDIAVYYEGWIGVIKEINVVVTARSEQNVLYRTDQKTVSLFRDITDKRKSTCEFRRVHHYPGQILVGPIQALDVAEVLDGEHKISNGASLKKKKLKLFVEEVSIRSLILKWNCQAHTKTDADSGNASVMNDLPPAEIEGDEVKKVRPLEIFRAATLQLGDRSFYVWKGDEKTVTSEEWKKLEVSRLSPCVSKNKNLSAENLRYDEYETQKTQSEDDKNLSDPEHYEDMLSDDDVGPINGSNGHNKDKRNDRSRKANVSFATRQNRMKKLRRSKSKGKTTLESFIPRIGERLVVDSIGTESRVTVMWQDGTTETNLPSRGLLPIQYLDDQEFFPGDFVIENKEVAVGLENDDLLAPHGNHEYGCVRKTSRADRTVIVSWFKLNFDYNNKSEFCCEREMSSYEVKSHPDYDFRPGSCVIRIAGDPNNDPFNKAGQVVDLLTNGKILVWWVNGTTGEVEPQHLYKVGDYGTGSDGLWNDTISVASSSSEDNTGWLTESFLSTESFFPPEKETLKSLFYLSQKDGHERTVELLQRGLSQLDDLGESISQYPFRVAISTLECATTNLVNLYKICRSFDGLISTNHFDITKFEHLVKKMNSKKLDLAYQNWAFDLASNLDILELLNDISELGGHTNPLCCSFFSGYSSFKAIQSMILYVCRKDCVPPLAIKFSDDLAIDVSFLKECVDEPIVHGLEALLLKFREINEVAKQEGRRPNISEIKKFFVDDNPDLSSFVVEYFYISDGNLEIKPAKVFSLASSFFQISSVDWSRLRKVIKKCSKKFSSTLDETCLYMVLFLATAVEYRAFKTGIRQAGLSAREFIEKLPYLTWRQTSFLSKELKKVANCIYQWNNTPYEGTVDSKTYCLELVKLLKTQLRELLDSVLSQTPNQNEQPLNVASSVVYSNVSCSVNVQPCIENNARENIPQYLITAVTNEDVDMSLTVEKTSPMLAETAVGDKAYMSLETAPESHIYWSNFMKPETPSSFLRAYRAELQLLSKSLPEGIHVRSFQDRTDLFSSMIEGPAKTPYEDGLFFFDFQLPSNYPTGPPACHYYAYCNERLNPNLYEEGKVCVSLLGTWSGRGSEVWNPGSNLLQVLVSIQGLILNAEPYYNEAGYEKQRGTGQAFENSRLYNEMVYLKMAQCMVNQFNRPHPCFVEETITKLKIHIPKFVQRLQMWISPSDIITGEKMPDFPLLPFSKGFCLAIEKWLSKLEDITKLKEITSVAVD